MPHSPPLASTTGMRLIPQSCSHMICATHAILASAWQLCPRAVLAHLQSCRPLSPCAAATGPSPLAVQRGGASSRNAVGVQTAEPLARITKPYGTTNTGTALLLTAPSVVLPKSRFRGAFEDVAPTTSACARVSYTLRRSS